MIKLELNLKCCFLKCLYKSLIDYLVVTFFTVIASVILLITLLSTNNNAIEWSRFYNNGNLFLYSISLFSSSLVYLLHHKKENLLALVLVIIFIVICGLNYSVFSDGKLHDTQFIYLSSIFFLISSSISFFLTQFAYHMIAIDVSEFEKSNQDKLKRGINFN